MDRILHFIYYVPPAGNFLFRAYNKYCENSGNFSPLYRAGNNYLCNWPKPVYAPFSITYYLLKHLSTKFKIRLYNSWERGIINPGPNDIILSHPLPNRLECGTPEMPWTSCDEGSITFKTLKNYPNANCILLLPYSHLSHKGAWLSNILDNYTKKLILICGDYWTRNWNDSPYSSTNVTPLQVNMAVDSSRYPLIKTKFSQKGKRKFFYIGHTSAYKNIAQLEAIAAKLKNFQGIHIGEGRIKGWRNLGRHMDLNPQNLGQLAAECDIFVNCSIADAQATTILEQMCLGFPVACTPQSGYLYKDLFFLDPHDTNFNCEVLENIQEAGEDVLFAKAASNRQTAKSLHSWEKFSSDVLKFIEDSEQ